MDQHLRQSRVSRGVAHGLPAVLVAAVVLLSAQRALTATEPAIDNLQIQTWIYRLSAGRFEQRQAASRNLIAAGQRSIPAITRAAQDGELEASIRAVEVLLAIYETTNTEASGAAGKALKMISQLPTRAGIHAAHALKWKEPLAIGRLQRLGAEVTHDRRTITIGPKWSGGNQGLVHLRWLPQLRVLRIYASDITDVGMAHLARLTDLTELCFLDSHITNAGLAHLKHLENLEVLYLTRTQVTNAGLQHLQRHSQLQWLDLKGTRVTDAGLDNLRGMTQLEGLDLRNSQVTDEGVVQMKRFLPRTKVILVTEDSDREGVVSTTAQRMP